MTGQPHSVHSSATWSQVVCEKARSAARFTRVSRAFRTRHSTQVSSKCCLPLTDITLCTCAVLSSAPERLYLRHPVPNMRHQQTSMREGVLDHFSSTSLKITVTVIYLSLRPQYPGRETAATDPVFSCPMLHVSCHYQQAVQSQR